MDIYIYIYLYIYDMIITYGYIYTVYKSCLFIYITYVYTDTQVLPSNFLKTLRLPGVVDPIEWRYELQELRHFISKCFSDQKEVMEGCWFISQRVLVSKHNAC